MERFSRAVEKHVPPKALLASSLMLAAFSFFSSVSSASVSLKSSGEGADEGGVDSPPAEVVSEPLIGNKRTQILGGETGGTSKILRLISDKWEKPESTRPTADRASDSEGNAESTSANLNVPGTVRPSTKAHWSPLEQFQTRRSSQSRGQPFLLQLAGFANTGRHSVRARSNHQSTRRCHTTQGFEEPLGSLLWYREKCHGGIA